MTGGRLGVCCPVRCGCEAQPQAGTERGLGYDECDGAIHQSSNSFEDVAAERP